MESIEQLNRDIDLFCPNIYPCKFVKKFITDQKQIFLITYLIRYIQMIFDIEMIRNVYANLPQKIKKAKDLLQRPLTLTEKILYSHLSPGVPLINYKRAADYVNFAPDRVAMQDAT